MMVVAALIILVVCCCHCRNRSKGNARDLYTITREIEEPQPFKRQASIRSSNRKDNSGVLNQRTVADPFSSLRAHHTLDCSSTTPSTATSATNPQATSTTRGGGGGGTTVSLASDSAHFTPAPPPTYAQGSIVSDGDGGEKWRPSVNLPNFPRSQLQLGRVLGEGEFGPVLLGRVVGMTGGGPGGAAGGVAAGSFVAVKTLEGVGSMESQMILEEFVSQMKLEYPNISSIIGMCTDASPFYIIYQYLEKVSE